MARKCHSWLWGHRTVSPQEAGAAGASAQDARTGEWVPELSAPSACDKLPFGILPKGFSSHRRSWLRSALSRRFAKPGAFSFQFPSSSCELGFSDKTVTLPSTVRAVSSSARRRGDIPCFPRFSHQLQTRGQGDAADSYRSNHPSVRLKVPLQQACVPSH